MASFNDTLIKSFYNSPAHSDLILIINGERYNLLSSIVQHHAPLLKTEFEKAPVPALPDPTIDPIISQIFTQLSTMYGSSPKKTLTILEPLATKEIVSALLESMYGKPFDVNATNYLEVYPLVSRFGMEKYITECSELLKNSITTENVLESILKIQDEKSSSHLKLYLENLAITIFVIPPEKILEFTSKMNVEVMQELLKSDKLSCTEDFVLDIVENWGKTHDVADTKKLMNCVQMEKLMGTTLVTKIKSNPLVDPMEYQKVLESTVISTSTNANIRTPGMIFALGNPKSTYPGFHLATEKEVLSDKFNELFKMEYTKNKGICCLDSIEAHIIVICDGRGLTLINTSWLIHLKRKVVTKNEHVQILTSNTPIDSHEKYGTSRLQCGWTPGFDTDIGLFVGNIHRF